jgi:hypothetical protein
MYDIGYTIIDVQIVIGDVLYQDSTPTPFPDAAVCATNDRGEIKCVGSYFGSSTGTALPPLPTDTNSQTDIISGADQVRLRDVYI